MKALLSLFAAIVIVLSLFSRISHLDAPTWADEATQIYLARGFDPVAQSRSLITSYELHRRSQGEPPLFTLMLHLWFYLGESIHWSRLLPTLIGMTSLIYFYKIGKLLHFSSYVHLMSVALVASSWIFVQYSEEVRNYSLSITSTFAMLYYLLKFRETQTTSDINKLIIAHLIGIATHYGNWLFLPFVTLAIFLLNRNFKNTFLWRYIITTSTLCIFLLINQLLLEINYIDLSYTARNRLAFFRGTDLIIHFFKYNIDYLSYVFGANPWFYDLRYYPSIRNVSYNIYYLGWTFIISLLAIVTTFLLRQTKKIFASPSFVVFAFPLSIIVLVNILSLLDLYPIGPIRMSLFYAPLVVTAYFHFLNLCHARLRSLGLILVLMTSIIILNNVLRLYRMPHRHIGFSQMNPLHVS